MHLDVLVQRRGLPGRLLGGKVFVRAVLVELIEGAQLSGTTFALNLGKAGKLFNALDQIAVVVLNSSRTLYLLVRQVTYPTLPDIPRPPI